MSIKQMNLVWEFSKHGGSLLLLMLAIANNANDDGDAYPGQEYLSRKIRKSEPYTRELIIKLISSRELRLTHRGGSGAGDPNRYKICLKERPASPSNKERPASPEGAVKGRLRGGDHAQKKAEPHRTIRTNSTNYTPPPPPAAIMPAGAGGGAGELERGDVGPISLTPAMEPGWTWKAIPNVPANRIKAHAHGPEKMVALYLYYLTQSGIKSPLRAALARMERGETDTGQLFEQIGELPPALLALLLNWIAEGASDYSVPEQLDGATVLGHAFAAQFKQPPSGIQSRPQQERQAEAEQQTIRIVSVRALTDLNLWRLLPAIELPQPEPDLEPLDPMPVIAPDTNDYENANEIIWQTALDQLMLEMVPATFSAWMLDTELIRMGPDEFCIGVPSTFARDWLANRMTATIERTLARFTGNAWPVRFELKGK